MRRAFPSPTTTPIPRACGMQGLDGMLAYVFFNTFVRTTQCCQAAFHGGCAPPHSHWPAPKACYNGERPDPRTPMWPCRSNREDLVKTVIPPRPHAHTHAHWRSTGCASWLRGSLASDASPMQPMLTAAERRAEVRAVGWFSQSGGVPVAHITGPDHIHTLACTEGLL